MLQLHRYLLAVRFKPENPVRETLDPSGKTTQHNAGYVEQQPSIVAIHFLFLTSPATFLAELQGLARTMPKIQSPFLHHASLIST